MSAENLPRLDSVDNIKLVLDAWVTSLAQVLESMTDQNPEIRWKALSGQAAESGLSLDSGAESETLWWEQPLQIAPEMVVWVAAPRSTWEHAGTVTLKAAGLETVERNEARNTWFEIIGQSLAAMSRSIGSILGRETTCGPGIERPPATDPGEWASVQLSLNYVVLAPLLVTFSPQLIAALIAPPPVVAEPGQVELATTARAAGKTTESPDQSRTMDLLMDVDLAVTISFGKTQLPLRDVVKLTTGSIVELSRGVNEQVEVLVNHCLIARGEVVVVEGNYGVRILEIASRQERLRSLK